MLPLYSIFLRLRCEFECHSPNIGKQSTDPNYNEGTNEPEFLSAVHGLYVVLQVPRGREARGDLALGAGKALLPGLVVEVDQSRVDLDLDQVTRNRGLVLVLSHEVRIGLRRLRPLAGHEPIDDLATHVARVGEQADVDGDGRVVLFLVHGDPFRWWRLHGTQASIFRRGGFVLTVVPTINWFFLNLRFSREIHD